MDIIAYDKTTAGPRAPDRATIDRETRQQLEALKDFRRLLLERRAIPLEPVHGTYIADRQGR